MTHEEMKARTKQFALRILRLVQSLPPNLVAQIIGKQLLRSGTSVVANYCVACRAKSTADFINKLSIVKKETDESIYRMEFLIEGKLIKKLFRKLKLNKDKKIRRGRTRIKLIDADIIKRNPRKSAKSAFVRVPFLSFQTASKENLLENLTDEGNRILLIVIASIKTSKEKRNPQSATTNPKSV